MAGTTAPRRLTWQVGRLTAARWETPTARTLNFEVPDWPGHLPGQHVDVRLTAPDGYSTERSYSLARPDRVELTVERLPDGEVSPYLDDVLDIGDEIEIRGPVGGWFVWQPTVTRPVLLLAGGSGIVPLMAMIRARRLEGSRTPFQLLYSIRSPDSGYYTQELQERQELGMPGSDLEVAYIYTRDAPEDCPRPPGRLSASDLTPRGGLADTDPDCYVCGPTGFVEAAADLLVARGQDPRRIKTERFGPSGG
jgi:ferredoxin-NADP reductase